MRDEDLATCVSCGLCLNDCPTYRVMHDEADSPRGRVQLIRQMVATDSAPDATAVGHLEACLVCRACETVCPSGVPFGRIMEGAREVVRERRPSLRFGALALRAGLAVISRAALLGAVTRIADLYARSGLSAALGRILPRRLGSMQRFLGAVEGAPFRGREGPRSDALLFTGCVMRTAFGDTHRATVRLIERDGRTVSAPPDQVCCGALHAHAGDGDRARQLARENVAAFADGDAPIVVNAAGCGAHLKAYGEVLGADGDWAERARAFAARVRDASEVVAAASVAARPHRAVRVVYQDACHLAHGQKLRRQPRALLQAMPGITVVQIADPERCCGSAGIYNLTHPEVAEELARQKVAAILAARPDVVVSANPGCVLQVRAGLREAGALIPVVHLMRFLDDPDGCLAALRATSAAAPDMRK